MDSDKPEDSPLDEFLGQLLATQVAIRGMLAVSHALHVSACAELERFRTSGLYSERSDAFFAAFDRGADRLLPDEGAQRPA